MGGETGKVEGRWALDTWGETEKKMRKGALDTWGEIEKKTEKKKGRRALETCCVVLPSSGRTWPTLQIHAKRIL